MNKHIKILTTVARKEGPGTAVVTCTKKGEMMGKCKS